MTEALVLGHDMLSMCLRVDLACKSLAKGDHRKTVTASRSENAATGRRVNNNAQEQASSWHLAAQL